MKLRCVSGKDLQNGRLVMQYDTVLRLSVRKYYIQLHVLTWELLYINALARSINTEHIIISLQSPHPFFLFDPPWGTGVKVV